MELKKRINNNNNNNNIGAALHYDKKNRKIRKISSLTLT